MYFRDEPSQPHHACGKMIIHTYIDAVSPPNSAECSLQEGLNRKGKEKNYWERFVGGKIKAPLLRKEIKQDIG